MSSSYEICSKNRACDCDSYSNSMVVTKVYLLFLHFLENYLKKKQTFISISTVNIF